MKLPISLLVLAALSQVLSVPITTRSEVKTLVAKPTVGNATHDMPTVAKNSAARGSGTKHMHNNQTSKRELFEGNYGERNPEIGLKYELKGPLRKTMFDTELQKMILERTPARHLFTGGLPQIAKISDVLSEHVPSYEAAVARQLNSPVPVYHNILSLPKSFEVPTPAASQSGYSNPKADRLRNEGQDEQKLQGVPSKSVKTSKTAEQANPSLPRYTLNQPRLRFDSQPQRLASELAHQYGKLPKEIFRQQEVPKTDLPLLYPLYNQREPFRYPGQVPPSQYSQQHGIFKILPVARDFNKSNEGNRDKNYSSAENIKGVTPKLQIDIPVHKQGYHAHPNGAISFVRFTHKLPGTAQHDTAPQPQSETFHQPQPVPYQAQAIPIQLPKQVPPELMLQSEEQNEATVKQKLLYPPSLQGLIEEIEKHQPLYEQQSKLNLFNHQTQQQPATLNPLQQHLLLQEPRKSSNLQTVQLQRMPAFTSPSQSPTPEFYFKKTSRSPITHSPRPFSYTSQSENYDLSLGQASPQLNSLPPLKPNYSKYVKPLEPNTTPVFLPTTLKTLPTFITKEEPATDQLISSTTIQPDGKGQENPNTQSMQKETESQFKTPQPLKPEVFHLPLLTVLPAEVQTATYLPFVTNEPQSIFFQYTTPQPTYQSTSHPTPQRHDVVIQRQEIQEIFFEPSQLSSTPGLLSPEEELHQLRVQHPHFQLFEQLLPYKHEYQDIHSPQQYILEARESQQKPVSENPGKTQQYLIQQHSFPTSHLHPLQQQQLLLQNQLREQEQSHQQNQAQQQQELDQAHQQQQQEALEKTQQQVFEKIQQQQLNQAQQQQQQALEEAQQVQQKKQESEEAQQYQKISLEPSNQIQISTLMPPQDTEKQTKMGEIQQQTESQTELQQDTKLQSSTGIPDKPPVHLSEHNFQQLVAQPDHSPLPKSGLPSYSDVQYFGKFAKTLFGNQ